MALEITCPSSEAALALVGSARRLDIAAKAREVRQVDRVVVRDGDAIAALLTRMGAHASVLAWEESRVRREVRASATRLANFDDANLRRSARAAVAAGARVERALEILGDEADKPLVVRLDGNNVDEGRRILAEANHPLVIQAETMDAGADKAAELANR